MADLVNRIFEEIETPLTPAKVSHERLGEALGRVVQLGERTFSKIDATGMALFDMPRATGDMATFGLQPRVLSLPVPELTRWAGNLEGDNHIFKSLQAAGIKDTASLEQAMHADVNSMLNLSAHTFRADYSRLISQVSLMRCEGQPCDTMSGVIRLSDKQRSVVGEAIAEAGSLTILPRARPAARQLTSGG